MSNPTDEPYLLGHHSSVVAGHAKRTADVEAAFFLPFLKPGMRLLDVGCGPGTITSGLAQCVEPGETIGIDPSSGVIEMARSITGRKTLKNMTFAVGNIHKHSFAPESFDAIFAHQVLEHVRQPVDALRQIRALLTSSGVVGVRNVDWGSALFYPEIEGIRRFVVLYEQLARRNGMEANAGRHLRRWFREAGFTRTHVTTSTVSHTDLDATRELGDTYAERILQSTVGDKILKSGLATRSDLEKIADDWRSWGRDPDAFFCLCHTEVVAWKQ